MRVLGLWDAPNAVSARLFASIEADHGDPAQFHRILRPGAAALIRKDVPGIAYAEAFDGFAVIDGDLFEPIVQPGQNGVARVLDLFRRHGAEALLWSSELTALLRCDPRVDLDETAIDQFLADGRVTAPWTTLRHIRKLPSAHYLRADARGMSTRRYWRQDGRLRLKVSYPERLELLEEALLAAHRRQITPGRRAGALLSGGVDSMLMVALLASLGCRPETFTYRYTHYDGKFNEGEPAARAAAHIGLDHREMPVGPDDIIAHFEDILWQHQGPLTYGLHSAILSEIAPGSVETLYSGQGNGGPSLFEQIGLTLSGLPALGRLLAATGRLPFARSGPLADLAYIGRVAQTRLSWRFHSPLTDPDTRSAIFVDPGLPDRAVGAREELFEAVIAEFADQTPQNAFCGSIQRLATADSSLQWTTAFARAHGMLGRCPYYDRGVIDLAYRLPRERDKEDLREIAAKYLPRDLAYAPKIGQTIPISDWLRGPLTDWLGDRLEHGRVGQSALFRPDAVRQLYNAHMAGRGSHGWTLWSIAALLGWQEMIRREAGRYISRTVPLSAAG